MTMFVTHPSVRIRGTENNYNPAQCLDPCCSNKSPHMHCPFCQKSESYHDPVILKAHYRVKHVDKGIDFAGLKILRCCDHCDIIGAIKGEKKFKGAHWHCYKCKNGFNRRDEAIKHYKTHFRNPQTTFQIHIAQEVNNPIHYYETQDEMQTFVQEDVNTTIHPVLTEAIMSAVNNSSNSLNNENDSLLANGQQSENEHIHVSVGANETVGTPTDGQPAIMIIHEEIENSCQENGESTEKFNLDPKCFEEWRRKDEAYAQREQQLLDEIKNLKMQLQSQAQEIIALKKREQELFQQLQFPSSSRVQELICNLQAQHFDLIQQQLLQIKRSTFITENANSNSTTNSEQLLKSLPTSNSSGPTMIALVTDQGSFIPLNQPMYAQSPSGTSNVCSTEYSSNDAKLASEECKSPSDSLVIIDLGDEMKKREADNEDISKSDNKRKK